MSLMFLTRSESVTTTVCKRTATSRCVSHSETTPSGCKRSPDTRSSLQGGHVSHHRWPGLDRHNQMKTTPVTRVFCLCGQVWWNQSAGSLIKRPVYTDLDEEANLFWATEALFMSAFLSTGHIHSLEVLLSRISLSYGAELSEFWLLLVLGQNWPVGVNVIHRYQECNCFNLGPKRSEKQQ